ncbi:hypothetical protein CU097_001443, partial [Rhizopus azygosporus]
MEQSTYSGFSISSTKLQYNNERNNHSSKIRKANIAKDPSRLTEDGTSHRATWQTSPTGSTPTSSSSSNESCIWPSSIYDESHVSSSSPSRDLNDPSSISASLSAPSTIKAKLNKYIEM